MQLYTLVLDYAGGTYLEQVEAPDASAAVSAWAAHSNEASAEVAELFLCDDAPVTLRGLKHVWCASVTGKQGLALLNIVATAA